MESLDDHPDVLVELNIRSRIFNVIRDMAQVEVLKIYPELKKIVERKEDQPSIILSERGILYDAMIKQDFKTLEFMATLTICTLIRSKKRMKDFILRHYWDMKEPWMAKVNMFLDLLDYDTGGTSSSQDKGFAMHRVADSFPEVASMIWAYYYECTDPNQFMENLWAKKLMVEDELLETQYKWEETFWNRRVPNSRESTSHVHFSRNRWMIEATRDKGFLKLNGEVVVPSVPFSKARLKSWLDYINNKEGVEEGHWVEDQAMEVFGHQGGMRNLRGKLPSEDMDLEATVRKMLRYNYLPRLAYKPEDKANWELGCRSPRSYKYAFVKMVDIMGLDRRALMIFVCLSCYTRDLARAQYVTYLLRDFLDIKYYSLLNKFMKECFTRGRGPLDVSIKGVSKGSTVSYYTIPSTYPDLCAYVWCKSGKIVNPRVVVKHTWAAQLDLDEDLLSQQVKWEKEFYGKKEYMTQDPGLNEHFWNLRILDKFKLLKEDGTEASYEGPVSYELMKEWLSYLLGYQTVRPDLRRYFS